MFLRTSHGLRADARAALQGQSTRQSESHISKKELVRLVRNRQRTTSAVTV